ncbi:MAG: pilus assembly protein N-terminal domain-containing protein [Bauldia sp.]
MSRVPVLMPVRRAAGRALAGLAAITVLTVLPATQASAEPIAVMVDHAKVMRVSRPAEIVIIGNPAIADATIQDNLTLIITGRSFGTTNLIVLDAAGQPIADELVVVAASNEQIVTVYRRANRQTYSCTPECSPTLAIGDNPENFNLVNDQIQAHESLSAAAADR